MGRLSGPGYGYGYGGNSYGQNNRGAYDKTRYGHGMAYNSYDIFVVSMNSKNRNDSRIELFLNNI